MPSLYCFPHSGGASYHFRDLAKALPAWSVIGVNYPRPTADAQLSVQSFASDWIDANPEVARGGAILYGHSLGGVVAFEIAAQLEARGHAISGVVLAASRPYAGVGDAISDPAQLLAWSFREVLRRQPTDQERDAFQYFAPVIGRDLAMYRSYDPTCRLTTTRALLLAGSDDNICPGLSTADWGDRLAEAKVASVKGTHLFYLDDPSQVGRIIQHWATQ